MISERKGRYMSEREKGKKKRARRYTYIHTSFLHNKKVGEDEQHQKVARGLCKVANSSV